MLEGIFRVPQAIVMDRISWEYYDWLRQQPDDILSERLAVCEQFCGDLDLRASFQTFLYSEFTAREERGQPRASWLPPYFADL